MTAILENYCTRRSLFDNERFNWLSTCRKRRVHVAWSLDNRVSSACQRTNRHP